jgi:hypothetical protein
MRKFIGLLAVAAMAALSLAGIASATSNVANGTTITATNSTAISLGSVITCNTSTVVGTITNNAAGLGVTESVTSASWSNCGSGNSAVANNLPWTLHTTGGGPTVWTGDITGVDVTIKAFGGFATCNYAGTLSAGNYDNSPGGSGVGTLTVAGNLTKVSGGGLCPATAATSGKYTTSPNLQLS